MELRLNREQEIVVSKMARVIAGDYREGVTGPYKDMQCHLVGGAVRDLILGRPVKDLDFATNLPPHAVEALLEVNGLPFYRTGTEFGTTSTIIQCLPVEITTFRKDVYPTDSRKPIVEFGEHLLDDLCRRDFTINAMAYNVHTRTLVTLSTSLADIENRVIRTVGDPVARFNEDPLRMLRAIRFVAQLGFTLETKTLDAILSCRDRLSIISQERIAAELVKILVSPHASMGLNLLFFTSLLDNLIPEFGAMVGVEQPKEWHAFDVFEHMCRVVESVDPSPVPRLAAFFHDMGKPEAATWNEEKGRVTFFGHHDISCDIARRVMTDLKMPNDIINQVCELVRAHMTPHSMDVSMKSARRLVHKLKYANIYDLIDLASSDVIGSGVEVPERLVRYIDLISLVMAVLEEHPEGVVCPVSGDVIMKVLDMSPGPDVGIIKDRLVEGIIDGLFTPKQVVDAFNLILEVIE